MKDKIIKSRVFTIFLITLLLVAVAITGTYAWFTWSSTENTTLTMSIGKLADVIFENGNNIVTDELTPVFNYTDGEKTNFEIINRDTTGAMLLYKVKLNIVNIPTELRNKSFKYALTASNGTDMVVASTGSFENYQDGDSIILYEEVLSSGSTYHDLYIYIDSNEENSLSMMNLNFSGNVEVTVEELTPTPLSDFDYYLGSESTTVNSVNYYSSDYNNTYNIPIDPITISSNEILLSHYKGTDPNVTVPSTYTVDGTTYNTVILSSAYICYTTSDVDIDTDTGIFMENTLIKNVTFGDNIRSVSANYEENSLYSLFYSCSSLNTVSNLPKNVIDMDYTFSGCASLTTAPEIPSSVESMYRTFSDCTSLTAAPEIPNSVTDMDSTFSGCTSLTAAPEIPNSITNMNATFSGCTSLTAAPEIPNSVTNMGYTFSNCTSLTTVPEIPNSVTSMIGTFYRCANLTGTVEIKSTNVFNVANIFYGTSKPITVYAPSGSTTYTKLNSLTTTNGKPANVTLQGR